MKTSERHHLKDNELAIALNQAQDWAQKNRGTITATLAGVLAVLVVGSGFYAWRISQDNAARGLLAEAMVVEEARVQPPAPPAGTTNDPTNPGGQTPGTYPTEQARLEAALPKFLAAADAYPTSQPGLTARFHAAQTLVALGRTDEALKQYDQLIASGGAILSRSARLGKAQAQIRAGQFDPAIATIKELSDQKDHSLPTDGLLMELARAYKLAGKTEDARKTLTQVTEQHADSPYAAEAKTELERLKG
jgi:tetratricopeptide (TPR) repeat protein